jgi:hypothetical protein
MFEPTTTTPEAFVPFSQYETLRTDHMEALSMIAHLSELIARHIASAKKAVPSHA